MPNSDTSASLATHNSQLTLLALFTSSIEPCDTSQKQCLRQPQPSSISIEQWRERIQSKESEVAAVRLARAHAPAAVRAAVRLVCAPAAVHLVRAPVVDHAVMLSLLVQKARTV